MHIHLRLFLFALIVLVSSQKIAAEDLYNYYMQIELKDCNTQEILLNEHPSLIMKKSGLIVSTTQEQFYFEDIKKITFSEEIKETPTLIDAISTSEHPQIKINDQEIIFRNFGNDSHVDVYDMKGMKYSPHTSVLDNEIRVSWSSFPAGIYIFRINHHSFKVIKK